MDGAGDQARKRAPRRAPKQSRSRETREKIVDAAERMLLEMGHDALTMRAVVRASGISVGTFYGYFPTKETLLIAVEERTWAQIAESVRAEVANQADRPPSARAFHVVRCIVVKLTERIALHGFTLDMQLPAAMLAERKQNRERLLAFVTSAIASQGERMRVNAPEAAAFLSFIAIVHGARAALIHRPAMVESGALFDEMADMVTRYLFHDARS